jgi:hypothetical protein
VPYSDIIGDVGVSPIAQGALTGFSITLNGMGFATSAQVAGKIYAADFVPPIPGRLTTAVLDMQRAYVDAAGRANPDFVEFQAGLLGGSTLIPGLYKFGTGIIISDDLTLSGTADDTWIFQVAGTMNIARGKRIILQDGAVANNIVWVVAGASTFGPDSHFEGTILGATNAAFQTRSSINGRVLVQTAATLQMTTVTKPGFDIVVAPAPTPAPPATLSVELGAAKDFAILAKAGVSTVPYSKIMGDVGVSPIAQGALTGFSITRDGTGFASSAQVVGQLYAADFAPPTPGKLTAAVLAMERAYVYATTLANPDFVEFQAGLLGGSTLAPGLYKFGTGITISDDLTLSGTADDTWIFQVAGTMNIARGKSIILQGGAVANNIVWVVAGASTFGPDSHFEGNILGATNAAFQTRSSINGRVLVQTAATLQMTTVTKPGSDIVVAPAPTPAPPATLSVELGAAGDFAILAKAGVSSVPNSQITGDVGVSPIAQGALTGMSIILNEKGFATSAQVKGRIFAADFVPPTPGKLTAAVLAMERAYVYAAGLANPDFVEFQAGLLGGSTLAPGLYKFGTGITISDDLTLSGTATDTWVFQVAGTMNIARGKRIILQKGAVANNIVWVVAGASTFGPDSHFEGNVLSATNAAFQTRSSINGRVLVQTAATLQMTTIVKPESPDYVPGPAPAPAPPTAAQLAATAAIVAATFTRCNAASVASSVAAATASSGDVTAAYADICTIRLSCIAAGNPTPETPVAHPAAYFTASDAYATASFTRCNANAVASSVAATAQALAEFNTCKLGDRSNPTGTLNPKP